jgi:DNA-binding Lrp family transcriptional regulator
MRDIFRILEHDGRASVERIATMTGLPAEQVAATIEKAEADRTILRYKAVVDWAKLGDETVWALIEVRVTPQRDVGFDTVAERIARFDQVRSLYLVSGTYDIAVLVAGRTMQEVAAFVAEKLAPLESVQGTVTHFLLKRYKDDGELLVNVEESRRLPIVP